MPGMRDIKRRIRSVKNTQQITRAMKMVSAAKLRKAQERLLLYRPYSDAHQQMIARVFSQTDFLSHPFFKAPEGKPTLLLLLTSDKGLCGSFNQVIIRKVIEHVKDRDKSEVVLYPIGKKGRDFFRKRGFNIWKYRPLSTKDDPYEVAQQIGREVIEAFSNQEFSAVEVVFAFFKSALVQVPNLYTLLPMSPAAVEEEYNREYIFEPSASEFLKTLLPISVNLELYRNILETSTAEQGARMTAMDSATNNAVEMIASLTLSYNKARQAAITKELIEVVSGADAIK